VGKEELDSMVRFLEPFRDETVKLQGKSYPSLPLALLSICRLKDHTLPDFEDSDSLGLLRARCHRLLQEKVKETMRFKVALFLWPTYKTLGMLSEVEKIEVGVRCG